MPLNDGSTRNILDATTAEPTRRERQRLCFAAGGYAIICALAITELCTEALTRRLVRGPEWWFVWIVFGTLSALSFFRAVCHLLVAYCMTPEWSPDALASLPPRVALLAGVPPASSTEGRRRGFSLSGGMFAGVDRKSEDRNYSEVTTPEVLRSTSLSLRSRSAARSSKNPNPPSGQRSKGAGATPSQQQTGGANGATPGRAPFARRLFSPKTGNGGNGRGAPLTPSEWAKAGWRALAVRPEDVEGLMKGYDERHPAPRPAESPSQKPSSLGLMSGTQGFHHPMAGSSGGAGGYYGQGMVEASSGGGWGAPPNHLYQVYVPGEAEMASASGQEGRAEDRDRAEQLLVRLGIAEKADEFALNVKTYVVRLMRGYLKDFDQVCSELLKRGLAEELLTQELKRQPELRVRNIPRTFVNLSLRDMATQFGNQPEFWVSGADGQPVSLFRRYQYLEETLHVMAGSGAAGGGNPAYVLRRLRILAEDDFMSAFVYDRGGGFTGGEEWTKDLPTDAAVVMRLFVCSSDQLLPREWEHDRPFVRQHFVDRQPCRSDVVPGRFFLARSDTLHPPHFFVVANEDVWQALPGPTNVFQAIALFLYAIKTEKSGYLGTGISIAKIVREIFGN